MKGGRTWFTTGMGLCTILCTVALAPAAERTKMIAVGGNDGMLHKTNDLGSAPQRSVPDTVAGVRGQSPAEASDVPDEQDPLAPVKKAAGELIDAIFGTSAPSQAKRASTNNEANTSRQLGDLINSVPRR